LRFIAADHRQEASHSGGASGRCDRLHETALAIAFALKVVGLVG
jgi:hypothetical protein